MPSLIFSQGLAFGFFPYLGAATNQILIYMTYGILVCFRTNESIALSRPNWICFE
jgi:hypothetical protein